MLHGDIQGEQHPVGQQLLQAVLIGIDGDMAADAGQRIGAITGSHDKQIERRIARAKQIRAKGNVARIDIEQVMHVGLAIDGAPVERRHPHV